MIAQKAAAAQANKEILHEIFKGAGMKLVHLSDLHLGKRVGEFSMLEDQKYILSSVLGIVQSERPDAAVIAGDVYDKSVPSAEAVELFDDFLVSLSSLCRVFVISGNHDSPERIAFGGRLMAAEGVYMSPVYAGALDPVTLSDEWGEVAFYMLPFIKPTHVRRYYPDDGIETYTDAVRVALAHAAPTDAERKVLVTHQFVTGAERSESEDISVGGSDNVDASAFAGFDYVALGHIHRPQNVGKNMRYCGTPLKYSFSEAKQDKSVTVVELREKGSVTVRTVPLVPLREMREIKGRYADLMLKSYYESTSYGEDYMHITLTDEEDIPDAVRKLRVVYRNLMKLDYDNARTRAAAPELAAGGIDTVSPLELFSDFYEKQNGSLMSAEQEEYMRSVIEKIWEEQ